MTEDAPPVEADDLAGLAVDFLDALLSSADVTTIGVNNWWDRATAALSTALAAASGYGEAVTIAAGKLQIGVISPLSAGRLRDLQALIGPVFETWRSETERDLVYIVALTRLKRAERGKTARAAAADQDTPTRDAEEALF